MQMHKKIFRQVVAWSFFYLQINVKVIIAYSDLNLIEL